MSRQSENGAIRVAVIGDFQIGKSSLVNCLLTKSEAVDGKGFFPTTKEAGKYPFAPGVVLLDTPGFDDTNTERTKQSEEKIESSEVVLFVKCETELSDHDERILRLAKNKPIIVAFNCWNRTLSRRWIPDLPENVDTCETIQRKLEQFGMMDSVLRINGRAVHALNVLWAQFGLGLPISEEQRDDIVDFAKTKLGLDLEDGVFCAEMLRRSGFLPVRDFLKNLPLELLKDAAAHSEREIDRIVNCFAEELSKRWNAA